MSDLLNLAAGEYDFEDALFLWQNDNARDVLYVATGDKIYPGLLLAQA
jgi:hypothetical protein